MNAKSTSKPIEQMKNADLIVSVESRKGGVGKTTAALCLSRILCKRGYAVLLLDLDVTGTNAADIAGSPFWKQDVHALTMPPAANSGKDNKPEPANLIALFEKNFMAGKRAPGFSITSDDQERITIDINKVNVLGSQIYNIPMSEDTKPPNGTTCIERPSVLFDDLHSLWLLEFVQHQIRDFVRVASLGDKARTAIILDNSPGFVGIAPAIHDWLTDSGPDKCKFLTVTSLDLQDLRACARAVDTLHSSFKGKWETSRLFIGGCSREDGIRVAEEQESFFMRLATSPEEDATTDAPLAFYRLPGEKQRQRPRQDGIVFCDDPSKYIAAIVNRVPRAITSGHLVYEPDKSLDDGAILGSLLGCNKRGQIARERMIPYDEYIENQFLLQSIQRGRRRSERRIHQLLQLLDMAKHELESSVQRNDAHPATLLDMDSHHHKQLRSQLKQANDVVLRARSAVSAAGLGHLARLIDDDWLPGSILPAFRSALLDLLRESELPYFEMLPIDLDTGPVNPQAREFVRDLKRNIVSRMHHLDDMTVISVDDRIVDLLAGALSALVGLSLTSPLWHSPYGEEFVELFAGVLVIELHHWHMRDERHRKSSSVQRFLAGESFDRGEARPAKMLHRHLQWLRHNIMPDAESGFADFYRCCTQAQARLLDFTADSHFLLQLFQFIAADEIEQGMLFPFVRGIAEDVIIKKTVSHEMAPNVMAKALKTAEYFRDFDGVLETVLADWGL